MDKLKFASVIYALVFIALLSGCGGSNPVPTPSPTPSVSITPSPSAAPTSTSTAIPTSSPSPTPTPSSNLYNEDFEGHSEGTRLPGPPWTDFEGTNIDDPLSTIVTDGGSKVFRAATGGFYYYNSGYSWTDYNFSLRLKKNTTSGFGVFFRKQSGDWRSYYVYLSGGGYLTLAKKDAEGNSDDIAQVEVTYLADTYYSLKITVSGSNIKVYFDNAVSPQIDEDDSTYSDGTIGLMSSDATAYYDDLEVTSL